MIKQKTFSFLYISTNQKYKETLKLKSSGICSWATKSLSNWALCAVPTYLQKIYATKGLNAARYYYKCVFIVYYYINCILFCCFICLVCRYPFISSQFLWTLYINVQQLKINILLIGIFFDTTIHYLSLLHYNILLKFTALNFLEDS